MSAAPKFLTITTKDEDLSRVQANFAEALRRVENSITTAITTVNTNIYNAISVTIGNVAPSAGGWDQVLFGTVTTPSNVFVDIVTIPVAVGTVITGYGNVVGFSNAAAATSYGAAWRYTAHNYGAGVVLDGTGSLWTTGTGLAQFVAIGNNLVFQVRGALNLPANWKAYVRVLHN